MTLRCTVKDPTLPTNITHNSTTQEKSNYNKLANELSDIITSSLSNADISFCSDGTFVLSCDDTSTDVQNFIKNNGLKLVADKPAIKHRVQINPDKTSIELIDSILKPTV